MMSGKPLDHAMLSNYGFILFIFSISMNLEGKSKNEMNEIEKEAEKEAETEEVDELFQHNLT